MPVFNSVSFLEAAVASVFQGGVQDIELIAVDDFSTDGSAELLRELSLKDGRVKAIFNGKNLGVAAARNRGLEAATGDYIAFCDADDLVEAGAYRYMLEKIGDGDIFIGAYCDLSDTGRARLVKPRKRSGLIEALFSGSSLWHKLFRRAFIIDNSLRFDEGLTLGEDVIFLSRLALFRPSYVTSDRSVYRYYHHDLSRSASLTHTYTLEKFKAHIYCREKMLELLTPEFPEVRELVYNHFIDYLDRFLPFIEGREKQAEAFSVYRRFLKGYGWEECPDLFLALTGVSYSAFLSMTPAAYFAAKYDLTPRERVYNEFSAGKIGLSWIIRYFIQWLKFKLGSNKCRLNGKRKKKALK